MTLAQAQNRAKLREARLILEAELPQELQSHKSPFPEQEAVWTAAMRFAHSWGKQGGSAGLLLQGSVGRGKSVLLGRMLFLLADLHGKTATYINCREVGLELRASYDRQGEGRSEWEIINAAKKRDVIAIDDLGSDGAAGSAEHVKTLVKTLIDLVDGAPKLFIGTTNLNDASLDALLHDPRESSRRASWTRLVFEDSKTPDYRRKGRNVR